MRLSMVLAGIGLGAAVIATPAQAQNYPWCALYNKGANELSCSFVSFDQCMDSVRGVGGFCMVNNTYVPTAAATPPRHRATHKPHKAS